MSRASISTGQPQGAFTPLRGESLSLLETATPDLATLPLIRTRSFEFSCRGDRARLEVLAPEGTGPFPVLVLLDTALETPPEAPDSDALRLGLHSPETWLEAGVAVVSITPPLFGPRRSPKFSERLESAVVAAAAGQSVDATGRILWSEFIRQSVLELRCGLDVLEQIWEGAPEPVVFAGSGLCASIGAIFCALDERVRAAALAAIVNPTPDGIDPAGYLDQIAPTALLLLDDAQELQAAAWKFLSPVLAGE